MGGLKGSMQKASPEIAARFTDGIVTCCESLSTIANRGARRDDVRPGLRITNYKRRVPLRSIWITTGEYHRNLLRQARLRKRLIGIMTVSQRRTGDIFLIFLDTARPRLWSGPTWL